MTRERVGRYAITGTRGEGGMGVVYAARDEQLGRTVALKMIKGVGADADARERLVREARCAASINHPAICQLFEIGEDNGQLFLAMELLEGESLSSRIARGPLPLAQAVSIALGILNGIDALQRQGLVHRDLKPSNIFLTPHGVKLLDFGLAVHSSAALGGETISRLTAPGIMVGTPQYAAPEQLQAGPVDIRTDLFAVGAILYEMLAGRAPFNGATPMEVFHSILYDQPPVLTGGPAVAALDRVIHRALAKQPPDRYQTSDAMAQDLRGALAFADTGSGAAARALTRLIVLPFKVLRQDAETDFLAFSLPDALTSSLSGLQSLVVRSSVAAAKFSADAPDFRAIVAQAQVDLVLLGTLMRAGPQLRVTTQLVDASAATVVWSHTAQVPVGDLFSLQDDLTGRIVQSLSLPLTSRERKMLKQDVPASPGAYELYLRANEMSRDSHHWHEALEMYERVIAEDPQYAPGWAGAGRMHRMIGKYVETETVDRLAQYLGTDTHWRPEAMEAVAQVLADQIRLVGLGAVQDPGYQAQPKDVTGRGDIFAMLDLAAGQDLIPQESVTIRQIATADGLPWRSSPAADVLVLGDSFSNIYSLESMGWGTSAGFVEQLSFALRRPLDRIVQNDAGAYATREILHRAGPERLTGKKVVVWQFAARELVSGDWKVW